MKNFLIYTVLGIVSLAVNFAIFNYSFNKQAIPFLPEEQRVESALLMLETTLPAYGISSFLLTAIFYLVAKNIKN